MLPRGYRFEAEFRPVGWVLLVVGPRGAPIGQSRCGLDHIAMHAQILSAQAWIHARAAAALESPPATKAEA